MSADRHYSKSIEQKLLPSVATGDAEELLSLLDSFSRSEQRTAGYMLGERMLTDVPTDLYWQLTSALVRHDSRAYLITLMKTFLVRLSRGTASLSDQSFARLASEFNAIEQQKVALLLLPELRTPQLV